MPLMGRGNLIRARESLGRARKVAGGNVGIGRALKISGQAVSQWRRVPAERVLDVEKLSGVPRHELRPDIYPPPEKRATA